MNKFASALIVVVSVGFSGLAQASEPETVFSVPAIGAVTVLPEVEAKMREIEKRQLNTEVTIEAPVNQQATQTETAAAGQYLASSY